MGGETGIHSKAFLIITVDLTVIVTSKNATHIHFSNKEEEVSQFCLTSSLGLSWTMKLSGGGKKKKKKTLNFLQKQKK